MSGKDEKPVANQLIVLREDDWAVLFDPETGNAFGLNPVAVFIWKLLDGKHTMLGVVESIRDAQERCLRRRRIISRHLLMN
jgi:SynChlorMet cassette protein ScmD